MCPLELPIFLLQPGTELTFITRQFVCAINQCFNMMRLWDKIAQEVLQRKIASANTTLVMLQQ
jgi:hypothetical protein